MQTKIKFNYWTYKFKKLYKITKQKHLLMKKTTISCLLSVLVIIAWGQGNPSIEELRKFNSGIETLKKTEKSNASKKIKTTAKLNTTALDFKLFNSENSNLWMNRCTTLCVDSNNIVWVGTLAGIAKVDSDFVSVIDSKDIINAENRTFLVTGSTVDTKNNKWFLFNNDTVCKFDNNKWITYDAKNSPLRHIFQLISDKTGNVWFCTNTGLIKFDGKNWSTLNTSNSKLPDNQVIGAFVDSRNRIWVGTKRGTIMIDGNNTVDFQLSENPLNSNNFRKAIEDKDGTIWFSLVKINQVGDFTQYSPAGLVSYSNTGKWGELNTSNSNIPGNTIFDLIADKNTNEIWCNIENSGLSKFSETTWKLYSPKRSTINYSDIYATIIDNNDNLWCATNKGLVKVGKKITK